MSDILPVLAVCDTVLFPPVMYDLSVQHRRSMAAVQAVGEGGELVCVTRCELGEGEPTPDHLFDIGTLARIERCRSGKKGLEVKVKAIERRMFLRYTQIDPFLEAEVQAIETKPLDDDDLDAHFLAGCVVGRIETSGGLRNEVRFLLGTTKDRSVQADLLAGLVNADIATQQELLETASVRERLGKVFKITEAALFNQGRE